MISILKKPWQLLLLFFIGVFVFLGGANDTLKPRTTLPSNPAVQNTCVDINRADTINAPNGVVFPDDAAIFNVRDYGAKGDGITDDSIALQAALNEAQSSASILYFPNGTYLVSRPLYFYRWLMIQGQSEENTLIKLKDRAPGYGNPETPNWVLFASPPGSNLEGSGDNTAHSQYVMNLTVDTGTGNPGAMGMMFISNNGGGLRDVTIQSGESQGPIGLDLRKAWDGPALYKNVTIEGFAVGIHVRNETYSSDFENLTLIGQGVAGVINENHPLTFRHLVSSLDVPVIKNQGSGGLVVVLDSSITGRENPTVAIENDAGGGVFLRNVCVQGYESELTGPYNIYTTKVSTIVSSHPLNSLFAERADFADKVIVDTPPLPWEPFSNWVSVADYQDLVVDGDWAAAIQAAIDSGKTTVYFPHGSYWVGSTIRVRGNVRVLQGLSSTIVAGWGRLGNNPLFRIEPGNQATVFIDRLIMGTEPGAEPITAIEHASAADLVVTNSRGMSYRNANTTLGDLFVDDMVGGPWYFTYPQTAWFRQLNIESSDTKIFNQRGDIWIQGFKSEGLGTLVDNSSSEAKTVVLGGLDYPVVNDNRDVLPSFSNRGGSMTVVIANYWTNLELVREEVNGIVRSYRKPLGERFTFYTSANPAYIAN